MMVGSTATTWLLNTLASGLIPYRLRAASLTTTFAAAPSQIPDAFAADTTPDFEKTGGSLASAAGVTSGRGCSSWANTIGSPPRRLGGRERGTISSLNAPASTAVTRNAAVRQEKTVRQAAKWFELTLLPALLRLSGVGVALLA